MKNFVILLSIIMSYSALANNNRSNKPQIPTQLLDSTVQRIYKTRPYEFDVTISIGFAEVTFHVHCENEEGLLTFIATSGAFGCDIGRNINDPNSSGKPGEKYRNKADLIKGLETFAGKKIGTMKYIHVEKSSAFKMHGKFYQVKPGKYLIDRDRKYPLDFKFEFVPAATRENKMRK